MRSRLSRAAWSVASLLLFFALWALVAVFLEWKRGPVFPYPWESLSSLLKMLAGKKLYGHSLLAHITESLSRWVVGFSLAIVLGVVAGVAIGLNRTLARLFKSWLHVLQLIPGLAWVPVALLLFGIGNGGTVFMVLIVAIAPIALATESGLRSVPSEFIESAKILGARPWSLIRCVLLPSALPMILQGLRSGLGNSWRVLVAAEMIVGSGVGLGYVIVQSRWSLRFAEAFAVIGIIAALGLIMERIVFARLENLWLLKTGGKHE